MNVIGKKNLNLFLLINLILINAENLHSKTLTLQQKH